MYLFADILFMSIASGIPATSKLFLVSKTKRCAFKRQIDTVELRERR